MKTYQSNQTLNAENLMVLGIETSCDETGIALYHGKHGLIGHRIYSQIDLHSAYGGVVPELASRDHIRKTLPLIRQVITDAGIKKRAINGIAYTAGPGLVGALLVGAAIGRSLAWGMNIPALAVHHMEGHLLAPMLEKQAPDYPFVALLVSGGHTQLIAVQGLGQYQIMGESLDDAAGEAFDKTAKLLGLPYPGGPALAQLAQQGVAGRYQFPRPMTDRPGLDFSFSGLKTAALNAWQNSQQHEQDKADIAQAFEQAVVETLLIKCRRALKHSGFSRLVIAGGVGANQTLRTQLHDKLAQAHNIQIYYPRPLFCTDNGAMIAYAGFCRLAAGHYQDERIQVQARWSLEDLLAISG